MFNFLKPGKGPRGGPPNPRPDPSLRPKVKQALLKCENCHWFLPDRFLGKRQPCYDGYCQRYPESIKKSKIDFCGEHKPRG